MVLPVDIMLDVGAGETLSSVSVYVSHLVETLSTVVEAVKRHQAKASSRQKDNLDLGMNFQYHSEGDLLWVLNKARKRQLCPKLQMRLRAPIR